MANFFTRLANRLWRAERHTRALADTLEVLLRQVLERKEHRLELVNLQVPIEAPPRKGRVDPFLEFSFLRKSLVRKNPELERLFSGPWQQYLKEFNITASIPKDGGAKRDLYFLAAYDTPWEDIGSVLLRQGIIQGVAVSFHEDLETALRELAR